jgi:3' terminal RNA ribose 2'-O-methyltransferase Hen1
MGRHTRRCRANYGTVLLTITTTHEPATDLGFLLHKHPGRVQAFEITAGQAHVFYPEAAQARCTAALLLEVDPVGLVRGRRSGHAATDAFALGQYVNDRPYAASSLLAIAIKEVFRSALAGRCEARPELAQMPLPLQVGIPALSSHGGPELVKRVFEPLGWQVEAVTSPLDPQLPDWGTSRYLTVTLTGELRLADALNQLYILLPVLDDAKHYWVSTDEVDKLVRAGAGWLAGHPERDLITRRYLAHRRELTAAALTRLAEVDDSDEAEIDNATQPAADLPVPDEPVPLHELRRGAVLAVLRAAGARTVGDLGCGEGRLAKDLLGDPAIGHVTAADVSARALQAAARRLRLDRMTPQQRARIDVFQSSLTYADDRLKGLDAAVLTEVIEHVDPPRLGALARAVLGHAAPGTVIVTTPNAEYNVRFETLPAGASRHRDHRFEWTRTQFRAWADATAAAHGYDVRYLPVGPDDPQVGPPTQMAVFTRRAA